MAGRATMSALVLAILVAAVGLPVAKADQPVPELTVGFQAAATTGQTVVLSAYLLDPAGNPISGQPIIFESDAAFMNTNGTVVLGSATTDSTGLAYLKYVPTFAGDHLITADFAGNAVFAPATASDSLATADDGATLYSEEAPFRIPGANVNLVVTVLAVVWGVYLGVTILFWLIARDRDVTAPPRQAGS